MTLTEFLHDRLDEQAAHALNYSRLYVDDDYPCKTLAAARKAAGYGEETE